MHVGYHQAEGVWLFIVPEVASAHYGAVQLLRKKQRVIFTKRCCMDEVDLYDDFNR